MQGVILTQGSPDSCIRAYPTNGFEEQAALYMSEPATTRAAASARRAFFSNAYPAELDRQGRVLIPQTLRDWAGLEQPHCGRRRRRMDSRSGTRPTSTLQSSIEEAEFIEGMGSEA